MYARIDGGLEEEGRNDGNEADRMDGLNEK